MPDLKPGDIGFIAQHVGPARHEMGMAHVIAVEPYNVEAIVDGKPICHPYNGNPDFTKELLPFKEAQEAAYQGTQEFHDAATKQINDGYDELCNEELHDFNLPNGYTDPEWAIGDIAYVVKVRKTWWSYLDVFKGRVIGVEWLIDPYNDKPGWRYTVYYKHPATKLDIKHGAKEGDFIEEADELYASDLFRTSKEACAALTTLAREVHADYSRAYAYILRLSEAAVIADKEKDIEYDKTE